MKRLIIMTFSILMLSISVVLTGCSTFSTIAPNDVKGASIWTHESQRNLTKDEISEILEQYNASEYGGKATGEGGTPDFGVNISLADKYDSEIIINDFYGKVEVIDFRLKKTFYLKNTELYELIKRLAAGLS